MATAKFSSKDRLNKPTSMSIGVDDAVLDANVQAFTDALDAIILGADVRAVVSVPNVVDVGSNVPPNNKDADRERKWLFGFVDSVTQQPYSHEIGCADNAQLPSATTDNLDLSAGTGLAMKTAADAIYRSPAGNAGVLAYIKQVGRNEG